MEKVTRLVQLVISASTSSGTISTSTAKGPASSSRLRSRLSSGGFFSGLSGGPKAACSCAVTRDKTKVPHDRHVHLREHRAHTQTAQRINRVRPVLHRLEGRIDNGLFASIVRQHKGGREKRLRCALADLGGEGAPGRDDVDVSFGCRCSLIGSRCGHLGELALALRGREFDDRQIATGPVSRRMCKSASSYSNELPVAARHRSPRRTVRAQYGCPSEIIPVLNLTAT